MKKPLLFFCLLSFVLSSMAQVRVHNLRTENLEDPIGLDITQPRFSWQLVSDKRNVMQTAYELKVGGDAKNLAAGKTNWSTGKISTDQSLHVPYEGPALSSGNRYYWQVRVWGNSGKASAWSAPALFQMGLLKPSDWKAAWIVPGFEED